MTRELRQVTKELPGREVWALESTRPESGGNEVNQVGCRKRFYESPISMRQAFLRDSIYIAINTVALIISISRILSGSSGESETFSLAAMILGIGSLVIA